MPYSPYLGPGHSNKDPFVALQLIYRLCTQEKLLRDGWTGEIEGSTRHPRGPKKS